jgi:hypothetical protein
VKLLIFRAGTTGKRIRKGKEPSIERFLTTAFLTAFVIMILAQAALMSPVVRAFLSVDNELEGRPLGLEEYLYSEGFIVLEIIGSDSKGDVKVLVNGIETERFSESRLMITVREGDIIEIDGTDAKQDVEVRIAEKSENVSQQCRRIFCQLQYRSTILPHDGLFLQ